MCDFLKFLFLWSARYGFCLFVCGLLLRRSLCILSWGCAQWFAVVKKLVQWIVLMLAIDSNILVANGKYFLTSSWWPFAWQRFWLFRSLRYATFRSGIFGHWTFSVWPFWSGDISGATFLYINNWFVYLNGYIGRRNVTLAGVIPTSFDAAAKWQNNLTGEMSR